MNIPSCYLSGHELSCASVVNLSQFFDLITFVSRDSRVCRHSLQHKRKNGQIPSKSWIQSFRINISQIHQFWQFFTWSNLTANIIQKFLPEIIATSKGHLDQVYQNTQSTNNYKPPAFPILGKDYDSEPIIKEELTEEKRKE